MRFVGDLAFQRQRHTEAALHSGPLEPGGEIRSRLDEDVLQQVSLNRPGETVLKPVECGVTRLVVQVVERDMLAEFAFRDNAFLGLSSLVLDRHRGRRSTELLVAKADEEEQRGEGDVDGDADLLHRRPPVATRRAVEPRQQQNGRRHQTPGEEDEVDQVRRQQIAVHQPVGELEGAPTDRQVDTQDLRNASAQQLLEQV